MSKPEWLKIGLPDKAYSRTKKLIDELNITTVCKEAKCPNVNECWGNGTATFMILGKVCTRNCRFCNVMTGSVGEDLDWNEIDRICEAVNIMRLKHVVITSVDRDDLHDLGAKYFAECVRALKNLGVKVEVLTPDFDGKEDLIDLVCKAGPDVFGHNIETVERISPIVRDSRASYKQSLKVLGYVADNYDKIIVKSALMVGLGENEEEVEKSLRDLRECGVKAVAIGQYLRPSKRNYPVAEYVHPKTFEKYKRTALNMGFEFVECGPFVRSSYNAHVLFASKYNKC